MFKGPGKIVWDNKSLSYPVFDLTGVNCISFKSVSFLWCSCMLYMVLFFFAAVSWFYFMFKNNFLSYCFFDKFVVFFVVLFLILIWFLLRFLLEDVISLLRALVILSLILKDAVSKILLHSFFNWMLQLHNERSNFDFIPLAYFFCTFYKIIITLCVWSFYTAFSRCYILYFDILLMFLEGSVTW